MWLKGFKRVHKIEAKAKALGLLSWTVSLPDALNHNSLMSGVLPTPPPSLLYILPQAPTDYILYLFIWILAARVNSKERNAETN